MKECLVRLLACVVRKMVSVGLSEAFVQKNLTPSNDQHLPFRVNDINLAPLQLRFG